jgi:hypothetical protein
MSSLISFKGVRLAGKSAETLWDVTCGDGCIKSIGEHHPSPGTEPDGRLLTPSLCHPHIHLDKCFLLFHPRYADLEIQNGDFGEALELTSMCIIPLISFYEYRSVLVVTDQTFVCQMSLQKIEQYCCKITNLLRVL